MMQRNYGFLEYNKALLHYAVSGRGKKILLCFHGFGQTNEHFSVLEEALGEEYTIYSFDLFYHGKSFWHEKDKPLSKSFWSNLINQFLQENNIDTFSVLGFSMGGKFALATIEKFFNKIEKVILIAPDGIKKNFWYRFATNKWMRGVFRSVILNPSLYFNLAKGLSSLHILSKSIVKFANTQMHTRKQRRRIYYSWVVFKELKFDMKVISGLLNDRAIKLEMFLGQYDKMVTHSDVKVLLSKLNDYSIEILPEGHSHLIEAVARYYKGVKAN